jgi:alcohol dehydrogenase (cytochrome c)
MNWIRVHLKSCRNLLAGSTLLLGAALLHAQELPLEGATNAEWPSYGGTTAAWRYSALDQVNTANVGDLRPAWIFNTGDYRDGLTSTPIVINGTMFVSTPGNHVFALDAATGTVLWHYVYSPREADFVKPGSAGAFVQNRGVAVHDGLVFMGTVDTNLVAIDQNTGQEVWRVAVDDSRQCGCNMLSAPLVVKDMVIVGQNGGDGAFRGYLTAFDTKTGHFRWRWHVIPGPGEPGFESWKDDSWKYGGGAPWMTGSWDPELDLVYWGTGNAAGDFYQGDRVPDNARDADGVNLYTASVVALHADTGELAWHFQEVPRDVWDFDSAYEVILMDREIQGRMRKILVHMNKSGLVFVLDRSTGEYLGNFSVPEVRTWIEGVGESGQLLGRKDPVIGQTINTCPTAVGAKSWNQMAYSPRTGLVYAPVIEACGDITATDQQVEEGEFYASGAWQRNLPPGRDTFAHLDAWDPVTSERVWSVPFPYTLMASVLATAGDLVFTGDPEGNFIAFAAATGEELWRFQTGAGHRGSAISYAVDGVQYIATPVGWQDSITGGMMEAMFPGQSWRAASSIVVFSLPESIR